MDKKNLKLNILKKVIIIFFILFIVVICPTLILSPNMLFNLSINDFLIFLPFNLFVYGPIVVILSALFFFAIDKKETKLPLFFSSLFCFFVIYWLTKEALNSGDAQAGMILFAVPVLGTAGIVSGYLLGVVFNKILNFIKKQIY